MSTALRLLPPSERPSASRRTRLREVIETWRRTEARLVPNDAIERLIDAVTESDAQAKADTKGPLNSIDDTVAEIHDAINRLHDAEALLAQLRQTIAPRTSR